MTIITTLKHTNHPNSKETVPAQPLLKITTPTNNKIYI